MNFKIEVTELQVEPWDHKDKLPGNIVRDFNYELNRAAQILPEQKTEAVASQDDNTKVMRVWGSEYLEQHKNDPEVKKILEEIKDINSKYQSEKAVGGEDLALAA
jgi:hypothetical protein